MLECQGCAKFENRFKVPFVKTKWIRTGFMGIVGPKQLTTVPAGNLILGHRVCSLSETTDWMGQATDSCLVPEEFEQATLEQIKAVS